MELPVHVASPITTPAIASDRDKEQTATKHNNAAYVAQVERRLIEYLRTWGLRDDGLLQSYSRRWIRHELHEAGVGIASRRLSYADLEQRVLSRAMNSTHLWIVRLTRHMENPGQELSAGLVGLKVRELMPKYPQCFLRINHLPAEFMQGLKAAARSVAPHVVHQSMPEQPLGELVPSLTPAYYVRPVTQLLARAFGRRRAVMESTV
jgi:hypothetical protein